MLRGLHLCGVSEPDIRSLNRTTQRSEVVFVFTVEDLADGQSNFEL